MANNSTHFEYKDYLISVDISTKKTDYSAYIIGKSTQGEFSILHEYITWWDENPNDNQVSSKLVELTESAKFLIDNVIMLQCHNDIWFDKVKYVYDNLDRIKNQVRSYKDKAPSYVKYIEIPLDITGWSITFMNNDALNVVSIQDPTYYTVFWADALLLIDKIYNYDLQNYWSTRVISLRR